jgi:hypothetical protein
MRINRLIAGSARPFTKPSGLRWMVARMISTNSLAAFAQEVNRTRPQTVEPVQLRTPASRAPESPQQRLLEAVPPAPSKPLPRGSLLDLRA